MTASQPASEAARCLERPHYLSTVNGSTEEVGRGRTGGGKETDGENEALDGWSG